MTQEQINLLFKQGYNQANWKQFLGETFTQVRLLVTPETLTGIDSNVSNHALRLGYVSLNESGIERKIAVYEVALARGIILERNRVGLRNLLRRFWKNIDAAFIVYHNPENHKWRFTFVSELNGYDGEGEFIKIKTEPKRYTYVLGEGESTRTAAERFALISKKGSNASLDDVREAFSVEKLSKTFFEEYKTIYVGLCDDMISKRGIKASIFNDDDKAIRDFNKKFLSRIVFLYFLQKKGWMGVPPKELYGKGDIHFLQRQFENFRNKDLFYKDFLTILFFETLNTHRKDDLFNYDNRQFLSPNSQVKIPFLSGGLFDEDDRKQRDLVIPAQLMANVFNFFNQYNFTIYEDDPNDHTVAVDPEMLGHIFENLLEDNKDKGAFYTPKEIVHYMCQESLIEYLCTALEIPDQKAEKEAIQNLLKKKDVDPILKPELRNINFALDKVKICDPAIGSGAFPMGLLQEIFTAKQTLWHFEHGSLKDFPASVIKLNIIQNSIYGVDIEKGAVDIARLRFWLSLVVDEDEPKALPNLDYKIVVGNSLVSKLDDILIDINWTNNKTTHGLFGDKQAIRNSELLVKISKEQKEYFKPNSDKKKLAADIRNLKIDLLINQLELMVTTKGLETKPNEIGRKLAEQTQLYLQTITWKDSIKKLYKLKGNLDQPLYFFDWKLDFPEVMNELINENAGFDIVIGNPPYNLEENQVLKDYYKSKFKTLHFKINLFACFIEQGFMLTKKNGVICYIIPNLFFANDSLKKCRKYFLEYSSPLFFMNLGDNIFKSATVPTMIFLTENNHQKNIDIKIYPKVKKVENLTDYYFTSKKFEILSNYNFVIETSNHLVSNILRKIEAKSDLLESHLDINQGIITGNDRAYLSNVKENHLWKQTIRGKDISKYYSAIPELYVKYSKDELACPRTIDLFEVNRKLLMRRTGDAPVVSLDEHQTYNLHTLYSIRTKNNLAIELYLGLLNSNLFKFIYQQKLGTEVGRTFAEIKILYIRQLPILKNLNNNSNVIALVQKTLSIKSKGEEAINLEKQIDHLVYRLYDLSFDEVKIINPEFCLNKEEYDSIVLN